MNDTLSQPAGTTASGQERLRVFFGHHKCATGWTNFILSEICFHIGRRFLRVNQEKEFRSRGTLAEHAERHGTEVLAYNNAKAEHAGSLPPYRGVHMVRDPRDIVVSAYFSHKHSHHTDRWPELIPHRKRLQKLPKDEGLLAEMDFSRQQFEDMRRWDYTQEQVLELKMEEFTEEPVQGFQRIIRFWGWLGASNVGPASRWREELLLLLNRVTYKAHHTLAPGLLPPYVHSLPALSPERTRRFVEERSFSKMAGGRGRGEENKKSHYRKGKAGDWHNHFNSEHKRVFKKRHNDALVKMGYEQDENW